MRIAAQLRDQASVGMTGKVGRHDRHRAAEEAEGRRCHALILNRDKPRQAPAHGVGENRERIGRAGVELEVGVRTARNLLAGMTPKRLSLGMGKWIHGELV